MNRIRSHHTPTHVRPGGDVMDMSVKFELLTNVAGMTEYVSFPAGLNRP